MIAKETVRGRKLAFWMNDGGWQKGKKTLFFIHGSGGDHSLWKNQYDALGGTFNILGVDLPGHGESEGPGEQEVIRFVEWIRDIIKTLKIDRPVLIGHSLGAAISLTTAIHYGDLLSGIAPVGGGVRMPVNPIILDGIKKDTPSSIALIVKFSVTKENREKFTGPLTADLARAVPEALYCDLLACDRMNIEQEVSSIRVPTLVICGDDDKMTPPRLSEFIAANVPGAKLALIPKAGHYVMLENVPEFNKALGDFAEAL